MYTYLYICGRACHRRFLAITDGGNCLCLNGGGGLTINITATIHLALKRGECPRFNARLIDAVIFILRLPPPVKDKPLPPSVMARNLLWHARPHMGVCLELWRAVARIFKFQYFGKT